MKKIAIYLLLGFIIIFLLTFLSGLSDDASKKIYYAGIWYNDLIGTFKYYALWVLPYWWLAIIIGTVLLALIFYVLRIGFVKLKE